MFLRELVEDVDDAVVPANAAPRSPGRPALAPPKARGAHPRWAQSRSGRRVRVSGIDRELVRLAPRHQKAWPAAPLSGQSASFFSSSGTRSVGAIVVRISTFDRSSRTTSGANLLPAAFWIARPVPEAPEPRFVGVSSIACRPRCQPHENGSRDRWSGSRFTARRRASVSYGSRYEGIGSWWQSSVPRRR